MKQSWVVGIVMLYIIIGGLMMVVTVQTNPEAGFSALWQNIPIPSAMSDLTPTGSQSQVTIGASDVFQIIWNIGNMAFLRFPPLMVGIWNWFWLIVCLPVACGFWVSVATIIRGVHSG